MLTILSDNQLRLISDAITTINEQLGELRSVMESSQTINFDGPAPAKSKATVKATVSAPVKSKPGSKSHGKTQKSRGRGKRALTASQVLKIKQQLAEGVGATAISREFKVHLSTVNCIKWGKTWKHVGLHQQQQEQQQETQPAIVTIHS